MSKILITGATGNLGQLVIQHLLKKVEAKDLAVLVRNGEKSEDLRSQGIDVRIGDYNKYETLVPAFEGIEKLYFISGSDFVGRDQQHKNVVTAAKETGVKHLVYTSFVRENENADSPIGFVVADHIETEKCLRESGMAYTILKHNLYMDMLPVFIGDKVLNSGVVYQPSGEGRAAFTLREDMAEVAAHILTSEGHEGKEYEITSDKSYSYDDIAKIISGITGKTIKHVSPTVEEFTHTMTMAGVPEAYIGLIAGFAQAMEQGEIDETNTLIEQLIGRKPTTAEEYLGKVYATAKGIGMVEQGVETHVYHIPATLKVGLHEHPSQDEIFYCIKGSGFGVLEDKEVELNVGDVFVAPAGQLHTVRSESEMYVTSVLIPVNRIICHCKQVSYGAIRQAMANGARTVEEIQSITGAGTECGNCIEDIKKILGMACGCKMVTMDTVVDAVKNGADSVEKIETLTGAGTDCGKCKALLQNIIDIKR